MKLGVAILAAGSARRLGQCKPLVRYQDGPHHRSLLEHAIAKAQTLKPAQLWVTLGASLDLVLASGAAAGATVLPIANHAEGISASIRASAQRAIESALDGLLLMLVDQYLLDVLHLPKLLHSAKRNPWAAVASLHQGVRMVPAWFPHGWFDRLLTLSGDQGAAVLLRASDQVIDVACDQLGDVDTPEDLAMLSR